MDQNWLLREVQLTFDEVDRLFCSHFQSELMMIRPGPTYWGKASCTLEGRT
jgi:hypothetical protein